MNKDASITITTKVKDQKFKLPMPEPIFDVAELELWDGIEGCMISLTLKDMIRLRDKFNNSISHIQRLIKREKLDG